MFVPMMRARTIGDLREVQSKGSQLWCWTFFSSGCHYVSPSLFFGTLPVFNDRTGSSLQPGDWRLERYVWVYVPYVDM